MLECRSRTFSDQLKDHQLDFMTTRYDDLEDFSPSHHLLTATALSACPLNVDTIVTTTTAASARGIDPKVFPMLHEHHLSDNGTFLHSYYR